MADDNFQLAPIEFWTAEGEMDNLGAFRLIKFSIPAGNTSPDLFARALASIPDDLFVPPGKGVILYGRGPIWGYCMMSHRAHPTRWVATSDPRLYEDRGGAVIVQSHWQGVNIGHAFPLDFLQSLELRRVASH